MRDFPQFGIKLPPHFVGGVIPRPAHIQGEFRQGIEPLDFRGQKIVDGVGATAVLAHYCVPVSPPGYGAEDRGRRAEDGLVPCK